jgi:hypothetical protein
MPVQLRFVSGLSSADYVSAQGWRLARLTHCPLHARGGCGFARHGSYARVRPPGTRIARWYCPTGHRTFSLLPDHLAARFPGTLSDIEHVVAAVEQAKSVEAAANALRCDDITLSSALRWVRRRVVLVRRLLPILVSLLPQYFQGCALTIGDLRARLSCAEVLVWLRERACRQLPTLSRPLGFRPPPAHPGEQRSGFQHDMGPDPPGTSR